MSQKRLRDIAMRRGTDYWAGSTWNLHLTVTDVSGGTSFLHVIPGRDNEFEILHGMISHQGASARTISIQSQDRGGNNLAFFITSNNTSAFTFMNFPTTDEISAGSTPAQGGRMIISGQMILRYTINTMLAGEVILYSLAARVRGRKPTWVTGSSGASGTTDVVNTDRFE